MTVNIELSKVRPIADKKKSIKERYLDYCDSQMNQRLFWYLLALITLSSVVMPISLFMMSYFDWFVQFVGFSILLFYTNIMATIAEMNTRVMMTIYFISLAIFFLAPVISFFINGGIS